MVIHVSRVLKCGESIYLSSTLADVMLCFELGIGAPMAPMKIASVFKIETENKQVPQ